MMYNAFRVSGEINKKSTSFIKMRYSHCANTTIYKRRKTKDSPDIPNMSPYTGSYTLYIHTIARTVAYVTKLS